MRRSSVVWVGISRGFNAGFGVEKVKIAPPVLVVTWDFVYREQQRCTHVYLENQSLDSE